MGSIRKFAKLFTPPIVTRLVQKKPRIYGIPDENLYKPVFSPWLGLKPFDELLARVRTVSLVSPDRCWVLHTLAQQALALNGEIWEAGVYKGGTALLFRETMQNCPGKTLRLFDTFEGMPETNQRYDLHKKGDFSDTSLEGVRSHVGDLPWVNYHKGFIPDTFAGRENDRIAMAHVDVDIYSSIIDCCEFIYPRLTPSGFMVFDDYGFPTCPGARQAVDEFFSTRIEKPLVLPTGQAVVVKAAVN